MVNLKNRLSNEITTFIRRIIKFEICAVDKIHWHKTRNDLYYNVSDVVMRERRLIVDPTLNYIRKRIPSLQKPSFKFSGATNPRRGNLVQVLFYKQRRGLILNQVSSKWEPPVCRPDPYTERTKQNQYRPLYQDENKDFPEEFPDPKKPQCKNWQHGPCFGDARDDDKEPSIGRDWWKVFDFCQEGDRDASCENCVDIDYCKRYNNSWLKAYSRNTMSCQVPNGRIELHNYCGSYFRFENETGRSIEYSEGAGHIRLGNATCEDKKKGHINFHPSGMIDIHSTHEEEAINLEVLGSRITVVPDEVDYSDSYGSIAVENEYLPKKSLIRIYKDGSIRLRSNATGVVDGYSAELFLKYDGTFWIWDMIKNNYIESESTGVLKLNSDVKIEINAPETEINSTTKVQFNTPYIYMGTEIIHEEEPE